MAVPESPRRLVRQQDVPASCERRAALLGPKGMDTHCATGLVKEAYRLIVDVKQGGK